MRLGGFAGVLGLLSVVRQDDREAMNEEWARTLRSGAEGRNFTLKSARWPARPDRFARTDVCQ